MDELMVKSFWASACQSASSYAEWRARLQHHRRAAELIAGEARKFLDRPPPESQEELSRRQMEQIALSARIASISHADAMAAMHADVADAILVEAAAYCEGELPQTFDGVSQVHLAGIVLNSKITSLCSADAMKRLIGSFKDEAAFGEVVRFGQEMRQAAIPGE